MLQNLMKSIGKMLATVLFVILLISFALWGIPNFSREGARAPIATVGSTEISVDRFTTALNERRQFMSRQTRQSDLALFVRLAKLPAGSTADKVPMRVLVPAFVTSELKSAFQIGFMIFIPFLVIDIVVASVLMSLGMMMLSPVLVALPFKLMLFVLADGWNLLIGSLAASFVTN